MHLILLFAIILLVLNHFSKAQKRASLVAFFVQEKIGPKPAFIAAAMKAMNAFMLTFIVSSRGVGLVLLLLFSLSSYGQYPIPDVKTLKEQTSVYDYANIFEENERQQLTQKLIKYSDSTSTQIVVITIKSTNGESIGMLAPRWGQAWGLGQKGKDNGILILVASEDRKIWIAPGYEVEWVLTAGVTGDIVRAVIVPEFKKGDYYAGIDKGVDTIFDFLTGKFKADDKKQKVSIWPFLVFFILFILFIIFVIIMASKGKGGGGGTGSFKGSDLAEIIILSGMGRRSGGSIFGSGGGFGGSSGGGFGGGFSGGFGDGGFSGGGAGGSW